jgi:hypothetical protein
MTYVKLSKTWVIIHMGFVTHVYAFGTKKLKNKQKLQFIWTYEIWSNFNHSKVPNYQMVKFFKKIILV